MYSTENSHKTTSQADLSSHVGPPGICRSTNTSSHLSGFCWLVASMPDSHLPDCLFYQLVPSLLLRQLTPSVFSGPSFPRLLPVSQEISRSGPFCGFRAKTNKGILWMSPTHNNTTNAQHSVTYSNWVKSLFKNRHYKVYPYKKRWH